jgi:hypothetical protein
LLVQTTSFISISNGSPVGTIAGQSGSASQGPDFIWDYAGKNLYVCTQTGSAATATWSVLNYGTLFAPPNITIPGTALFVGPFTVTPSGSNTITMKPTTTVGNIDNVNIGSTTPAAGAFTTLKVGGIPVTGGGGGATGSLLGVQTFTSGSAFYTPTTGTNKVLVKAIGGGGAGGGAYGTDGSHITCCGGGGAGGYAEGYFTSSFSGVTVTVGAAGVGASGASGGNGGGSSFGSLLVVAGGSGGVYELPTVTPAPGGAGAAAPTTGYLKEAGGAGQQGYYVSSTLPFGGAGANSPLGAGGASSLGTQGGTAATGYGAGGGGGSNGNSQAANTGGNGAPGLVVVYEYS